MDIIEEQFRGDRRHRTRLGRRDIRPDHLHHIVEQHTKGELKHRALRRGANERLEMKDFGDLLEHPLDTPAREVEVQEIRGREPRGVEQIGEQNNRLLARADTASGGGRSAGAWPAHSLTSPSLAPTRAPGHPGRAARGAASAQKGVLG